MQTAEIEILRIKFIEDDTSAGEKLLEAFNPLIMKYLAILWYDKYKNLPESKTVIKFILSALPDFKTNISKALQTHYTIADVIQTLKLCLLRTAKQYRVINKGFKYLVKEEFVLMLKDISTCSSTAVQDIISLYDKSDRLVETPPTWFSNVNTNTRPEMVKLVSTELLGERLGNVAFYTSYLDVSTEDSALLLGLSRRQVKRDRNTIRTRLLS